MISPQLEQLFQSLETMPPRSDWSDYEGPRFVTNKITISVGSFYERLRYAVDYQEEHMLRRAAIERIVRRVIRFSTFEDCGRSVLEELVRARYIENNTVPESFANDIQNILEKYRRLERRIEGGADIVWSYAAIEIEQHLFPLEINERTFTAVFQTIVGYIKAKEPELMSEEAFNLRVYIACRRVLLLETHSVLNFSLFKMMVPEWRENPLPDESVIEAVAKRFSKVQDEIQTLITDPVQWKITGRLHNESIYFSLINEIVRRYEREAKGILSDFQQLQKVVSGILKRKYEVHKQKISQSGTSATIYILITKIIVGLAVELPYEIFILQEVSYTALGINTIFFPLLLLFMTKTIRHPGEENTKEVIENLHNFIENETEQEVQYVTLEPKSYVQQLGHLFFATTFFAITFGVIIYALDLLEFNPASIFLFLLFLSIVTYMGLRIRHRSREWTLEDEDESFGGLMWFLIVLPVTRTGRWISEQLSSINIFVFFMDFILETPFKMLLGSFDSFINYVKETRRDGV